MGGDAEEKNKEILKKLKELKELSQASVGKYVRKSNHSLVRVVEKGRIQGDGKGESTSTDFVVKGRSNNKLVRLGAPPIVRNNPTSSLQTVNVDDIMKKYSITQHAVASNVSQDFISVKNKLIRKSLIKTDSTSSSVAKISRKKKSSYCIHFARGHCKDLNCRFEHSVERVNACKNLLQYGKCEDSDSSKCQFNHNLTPHNTPLCLYHCEKGLCIHPDTCMYSHILPQSPDAPICPDFAQWSYCEIGEQCTKKHLNLCPDWYASGNCKKGSACRLKHMNLKVPQLQNDEEQSVNYQIQQVLDDHELEDYIAIE